MTSTADRYDERGEDLQSLPLPMLNLGGRTSFSGPVRTVRCFEDNPVLRSVLATPGDGAVLVVDGGGSLRRAVMGDAIGALAVENGWSGVVIAGAVRDRVALGRLDLGVKALGTNPRSSTKLGHGVVDEPVEFGGVVFRPRAVLWSDEDGILVER